MITCKDQLAAYYLAQGLTGQAHMDAVDADMALIASFDPYEGWQDECLETEFDWTESPQGHEYWRVRAEAAQ